MTQLASLAQLAALSDPTRRALYDAVAASQGDLTRDQAASLVGIKRGLAAFHLDKLVAAGLLAVSYRRAPGRSGPGAGRPAKHYAMAATELIADLPQRRYDLAARILLEACTALPQAQAHSAMLQAAAALGREAVADPAIAGATDPLAEALGAQNFSLSPPQDGIRVLTSCPFGSLATSDPTTVCKLNYAFVQGMVGGLEQSKRYQVTLQPGSGNCCLKIGENQI